MIPETLITYIETAIIPRYRDFDKAHNRTHTVPFRPKASTPLLVLHICVSLENHQRTFSLEISHELCYTYVR